MASFDIDSLDLRSTDASLDVFARRFFDDGLVPALSTAQFKAFDRSRYTQEELDWGVQAWSLRTLDEYRSQVGFTEFLMELTELGASFDILSTGVRVVRDESRHVELCKRLVVALGGEPVMPGTPGWVRSDTSRPLLERVLRTTIASLCVGETLSMALLAAMPKLTPDPLAKAVATTLAADESIHSQFGWRLLPILWPVASARTRRVLTAELSEMFEYAEAVTFEGTEDEAPQRNPFGELKVGERRKVFDRCIERDVLRRFHALGIKAQRSGSRSSRRAERSRRVTKAKKRA